MEPPPPSSFGSSDDAQVREVSNFVWDVPESGQYSYSSGVWVRKYCTPWFKVEVRTTWGKVIISQQYRAETSFLEAIRILVRTCPDWTIATFYFGPYLSVDPLISQLFSLMRSVSSLASITLFGSCLNALPTLVCENPYLRRLDLGCAGKSGVLSNLEDAERVALCFSRNSVLKSCMVKVSSGADSETWAVALRPFTTRSEGEANTTLKDLGVTIYFDAPGLDAPTAASEAIASVLRLNTTLERLEVLSNSSVFGFLTTKSDVMAQALATNRTLKKFWCYCIDGVGSFSPGKQSSDPHLTTLELRATSISPVGTFLRKLAKMLARQTTLQHVEVVFLDVDLKPRLLWEVRSLKRSGGSEEVCTQDLLEAMMHNELRKITTLQSLAVGGWTLHRARDRHWQMIYGSSCLRLTSEYEIKVKMRR